MSSKLRQIRERLGLNRSELGTIIGVSGQQVGMIEAGKRGLTLHRARNLARHLGVSLSDIVSEDELTLMTEDRDAIVPDKTAIDDEYVSIPRYDASFSAGHGSVMNPHAQPLGWHKFELEWVRALTSANIESLCVVRVRGDSMEPTLSDGDWVLMDQTQRTITQEGVYAIQVGDSAWIKRISLKFSTKKIRIISDNERYGEEEVSEEDIYIVGRVVAIVARRL